MSQAQLAARLQKHGGSYSASVGALTHVLVTTESEWNKNRAALKMKAAVDCGVLIVKPEWLAQSEEAGRKLSQDEMRQKNLIIHAPGDTITESKGRKRARDEEDEEEEEEDSDEDQDAGAAAAAAAAAVAVAAPSALSRRGRTKMEEERPRKRARLTIKGRSAVDIECHLADDVHVYESQAGDVYSAHLSLTDVARNRNTFYIIQVLQKDADLDTFYVWRHWGRTGSKVGDTKLERGHTAATAVAQFKELYQDKTGNAFDKRSQFEKKPGLMYEVDIQYADEQRLQQLIERQKRQQKAYSGRLDPRVADLVRRIFDIRQL